MSTQTAAAGGARIAVAVSGTGSNLKALRTAERRGLLGGSIVLVLADQACPAIDWELEQGIPVALEIGKALVGAVDSDTLIEPIYQEVGGGSPELAVRRTEADAAIKAMTRVEVIDGLQVGFKELSSLDLGHRVSEQAYLVVWRQDEHLVGFVFRSRRDIKIAEVVALAPKLVALVRGVL